MLVERKEAKVRVRESRGLLTFVKNKKTQIQYAYIGWSLSKLIRRNFFELLNSYLKFWHRPTVFLRTNIMLSKLSNYKSSIEAFVFANGPSLNQICPQKLKEFLSSGADLFVINGYYQAEIAKVCFPTHYILADPVYLENIDGQLEPIMRYIKSVGGVEIWVPCGRKLDSSIIEYGCNYFDSRTRRGFSRNLKPSKPIGVSSITGHYALGLAELFGYRKVYIAGFDSSTYLYVTVDSNSKIVVEKNYHAYDSKNPQKVVLQYKTMSEMLQDAAQGFDDLSKFSNGRFYNLASNTLVDSIPTAHISRILMKDS